MKFLAVQALSLGIHESQSLLWERMVALSQPFAEYLTPLLKEKFSQLPQELTPQQVRNPSVSDFKPDPLCFCLWHASTYELRLLVLADEEKLVKF